ncbi:MAG: NAD(P)-dependent oxidoreductase [Pseudomonadota bacterium]
MTVKVGYVGLGAMGAPMLRRLAGGAPEGSVFGFDASSEVCDQVCSATGAVPCASIAEIAASADILFSCIPNNEAVLTAYLGEPGIASAARPGTITIDCSTIGPEISRQVHSHLAEKGVHHLDASMLGSVTQAEEGTISFVVGGDAQALEQARPSLEKVGALIRHCGPSGAGNQMKLLHQILVAGHAVAVAEAMTLCSEIGADEDAFYEIVTQGTGFAYSRYFEKRVPRMRAGEYGPLFMLKFMAKDARLARDMSPFAPSATAQVLPMLNAIVTTLEEGEANGLGENDFSAATKVLQARFEREN